MDEDPLAALQRRKQLPPEEISNVDPAAFYGGHVLSMSETAILLTNYYNTRLKEMPKFQMPPTVQKTKEYVDKFAQISNEQSSYNIRRVLNEYGCWEFEITLLANLMPETPEEAMALLPSLKDPSRFDDQKLEEMLHKLMEYKQFAG